MAAALYGGAGKPVPYALARKLFCARHGWKPWEYDLADICDINEWNWMDDHEANARVAREKREKDRLIADLKRGGGSF